MHNWLIPALRSWVLVPREPTDEMIAAVAEDYFSRVMPEDRYAVISDCWRAMVEAAPPSTSDQERARDMVSFALRRAELCGTPHRMAAMPESIPAIDISIASLRSILEHLEAATRREAERAGYERALEDAAQEIIRLNSGGPIIAQEQAEAIRALKGLEEELI